MKNIVFDHVVKAYDKNVIVKDLNMEIREGERLILLGPSGCGKSTTLRMIAGLERLSGGNLYMDGRLVNDVPCGERNVSMVFQNYALFPHLSVYDNVAFGLKIRKLDKAEMDRKVKDILEVCGLTEFADRFPQQMSGGQRQRVALARALVIEPKLLLLDEPLSNLDAKLRINMRMEIKRIQKQLGITTLFVTHDQEECFSISDKVAVMNRGVIEQYDTPEHIYSRPKTEFVARFIGFENFLTLHKGRDVYRTDSGEAFTVKTADGVVPSEETVTGTIRPEDILVDFEGRTGNVLTGTVGVRTFLGKSYQYEVHTEAGKFLVNRNADESYEEGQMIRLYLPEEKLILVDR